MKFIRNQKGFTGLEVALIVVVVALIAGGGVYVYTQRQEAKEVTSQNNESKSSKNEAKIEDDATLIRKAVETDCKEDNSDYKLTYFGEIDKQGNNAKVSVRCGTTMTQEGDTIQYDGGYVVILNKASSWSVVFKGQQAPDVDMAKKYNFPTSWYVPAE